MAAIEDNEFIETSIPRFAQCSNGEIVGFGRGSWMVKVDISMVAKGRFDGKPIY